MKPSIKQIVRWPALQAAPALLGHDLVRRSPGGIIRIKIVETEAYHQSDPASHSFRGLTPRTAPMFASGGRLYVYFTYGMHYCMNIVTGPAGQGEAVLIRAGQPLEGIAIMKTNRKIEDIKNLTNGPGKLTQALGIFDSSLSGKQLGNSTVWLEEGKLLGPGDIIISPRIGIRRATDAPMRFHIRNNQFVSKL